jgi:hypothetical protein
MALKMTPLRQRLTDRRPHWLYRFECDGKSYTGGIGRFEDGRIAEIFINGSKVGTATEANAQDAAIVASLALQHGCPVDTIRRAPARTGRPGGPSNVTRWRGSGLDGLLGELFADVAIKYAREIRDPAFVGMVMAAIYFKTTRGLIKMGATEQGFLGRVARLAYVGSLN